MIDAYGYTLCEADALRWQDAVAAARRRNFTQAVALLDAVLATQADCVPALLQSAHWALVSGRYRDARDRARRAATARPRSFELLLETVRLLRRFEDGPQVDRLVAEADWERCRSPDVLVAIAGELAPVGLHGRAVELLDRAEALAGQPLPAALRMRGTIKLLAGEVAAGRAQLQRALRAPDAPQSHLLWLMSLHPDTEAPEFIADLQQRLEKCRSSPHDEAHLAYAAHNMLHAAGRYDEAWSALERGCRAKRALVHYDEREQEVLFAQLEKRRPCSSRPALEAKDGTRVIFVLGMHRSGTTLLERMLGGHGAIADGGESYGFTAALRYAADRYFQGVIDADVASRIRCEDLETVADEFREHARWRAAGKRWLTEKLPSNFLNLGFIMDALPEARVLHMRRDPIDTCFSNLRTYFSDAAPYSYDQQELGSYYLRYQALMRHWSAGWPGRILDVDYDELVDDPAGQARRILDFCGLEFEPGVLDLQRRDGYVSTASLATVRSGIRRDRGGVWRHYERQLQPLLEVLQPAYR